MDVDVSKLSTSSQIKVDQLYVSLYITNQLDKPGFKGFAKSLSSVNSNGPFDVLPMHENFVTQFKDKIEIVRENGEKINYPGSKGIIEVANNIVRVYLKAKTD